MPASLIINGERTGPLQAETVAALLEELGYTHPFVAVALNHGHVPRTNYASTPIRDGDEIEILAPMAGG